MLRAVREADIFHEIDSCPILVNRVI